MRAHSTPPLTAIVAAVALVAAAAVVAAAQQPGATRGAASQQTTAPRTAPAQPVPSHPGRTRGAHPQRPVTPMVPPFPNIATLSGPLPQGLNPPFAPPARDLFRVNPRSRGTSPYFFPGFAYGGGYAETAPPANPAMAPEAAPPTGTLRLAVTPGSTQVFVDGYYAGTADDIERRGGLVLPEGPHHLELRASGYTTQSFDLAVPAHDAVTYRGALDAQSIAPAAARGPATIYVIPGCYMGNVPPRPERVGPGCNVKNVRIVTPPAAPRQPGSPSR